MRLLFAVHRYAPFPGGSEYYTKAMAEEALSRGHEVTVFAGEHQGDHNGVHVTSDPQILGWPWDLIVVHGGDVGLQNFVLTNASRIPSPILYMLILPSNSDICVTALKECTYLGWSTPDDINHIRKHGQSDKAKRVRHGIKLNESIGKPGFKAKHGINKRMFLSCGGYWPNKKMRELADVFTRANLEDAVLVTTGYDNRMDLMPDANNCVMPLMIDDKAEVLSAISEADCYLMHSNQEGFGLVILESMLNETPWISRQIAGAAMLNKFGQTYQTDGQLINLLKNFDPILYDLPAAKQHILDNHTIRSTVDDIEAVIIAS
jgi:glycosyltransferase involved in cell wall biosynthesis